MNRLDRAVAVCVLLAVWVPVALAAAQAPAPRSQQPTFSCGEIEAFLKTARIGRQRSIPVGVTVPSRATLEDGNLQHDAAIQTVDITKQSFQTARGTELNFRDTWQFNVAGYELAKMLNLNMVPPYIERRVSGTPASVSWWVPDAMMERDRFQKKITPHDHVRWAREISAVRVFHELIGDSDFNMTNVLITQDWRVWMIDFSRAFRPTKELRKPDELRTIDRTLLASLRGLTREALQQAVRRWLSKPELEGLLARRDLIVQLFDMAIATRGEASVLYDFSRTAEPCGAGLQ